MSQKSANREEPVLSAEEIALYDRQIRLWGMKAQANMRSAKVLLINIGSIGTEITKNIVLSGIGHLCVMDSHTVEERDLGSQFLLGSEDVGKSRINATRERILDLNPRVELSFAYDRLDSLTPEFISRFNLVIGTELSPEEIVQVNQLTRQFEIPLYIAGSNGLFGYIFVDLIEFHAEDERIQSMRPQEVGPVSANREIIKVETRPDEDDPKKVYEKVTTVNRYQTFEQMLRTATLEGKLNRRQLKRVSNVLPLTIAQLKQKSSLLADNPEQFKEETIRTCQQLRVEPATLQDRYMDQFIRQSCVEFAPVSAVIGGAVAQDVVNILGKRQSPLNNFLTFDGITLDMPIFEL